MELRKIAVDLISDAVEFAGWKTQKFTAESWIEFVSHERIVRSGRVYISPNPLQLKSVIDGTAAARLK